MSLKKVYAVLEFLIEYFSRKHIAKLLLKLPAGFFPNHRIILSPIPLDHNRKIRRLTLYDLKKRYGEESEVNDVYCNCRSTHSYIPHDKWRAIENIAIQDMMVSELIKPAETKKPGLKRKIFEHNLFATPPLRKITVEQLSSVKLRRSANFPISPRIPEIRDITEVLRKRFVVMHSPNMLSRYTESGDESDNSTTENSFCNRN